MIKYDSKKAGGNLMDEKYIYLILGLILGLTIAMYLYISREEKIENKIRNNQKIYSTKKLDITMEKVVSKINIKIKEAKRELTEEEKNEIITQCYKENF